MSQHSPEKHVRRFNLRLKGAVVEYERKRLAAQVSLPSRIGKLVIVVSNQTFGRSEYPENVQREAFHAEAEQIADLKTGYYGGVEIRRKANAPDIAADLGDKEVSDMIMIGHGAIDGLWLDTGGTLRWRAVAKHARFLKQGRIEQRMCGHFNGFDAVPLGTFALLDQRKLVASVGEELDDVCPDESLFQPVYEKSHNTVEDIKGLIRSYEHQYTGGATNQPA